MTPLTDTLVKVAATFFGIGYSRWAPGTLGSLAGIILVAVLGPLSYPLALVLLVVGYAACKPATRIFASGDPSCFVLDEVCGMMIGASMFPRTFFWHVVAFALFRFFDIVKPWPISLIQKQKRPSAIMSDDVLAGVFTALAGLAIFTAVHFFSGGTPAS